MWPWRCRDRQVALALRLGTQNVDRRDEGVAGLWASRSQRVEGLIHCPSAWLYAGPFLLSCEVARSFRCAEYNVGHGAGVVSPHPGQLVMCWQPTSLRMEPCACFFFAFLTRGFEGGMQQGAERREGVSERGALWCHVHFQVESPGMLSLDSQYVEGQAEACSSLYTLVCNKWSHLFSPHCPGTHSIYC